MNVHQIESLLLNSKKREELPFVKSVDFIKILFLMDKSIKTSLFLKTKKMQNYISTLAKEENLSTHDYSYSTGVGRGAKIFLDARVATYLVSELSVQFKYHLINSLVLSNRDITFECKDVPKMAISKIYQE
jgi:hypothetical protein